MYNLRARVKAAFAGSARPDREVRSQALPATMASIGVGAGGDKGIDPPPVLNPGGDNPPHFSGKPVSKNYVTGSLITTNDGINCVI